MMVGRRAMHARNTWPHDTAPPNWNHPDRVCVWIRRNAQLPNNHNANLNSIDCFEIRIGIFSLVALKGWNTGENNLQNGSNDLKTSL